jgi:hypothetical protein
MVEVYHESTKPQDKVISSDYDAICVHTLISKVKNAEATFSILLSLEKFWNIDISIVLKCCKYLYVKTGVHFILFCDHTWTLPIGSAILVPSESPQEKGVQCVCLSFHNFQTNTANISVSRLILGLWILRQHFILVLNTNSAFVFTTLYYNSSLQ